MRIRLIALFTLASLLLTGGAQAGLALETVAWDPNSPSGGGSNTGTLGGIVVTLASIPGGNSGATISDDWTTSMATSPAVSAVTSATAAIWATNSPAGVTQIVEFSSTVTNPILLVNYADSDGTYNFGSLSLTLLNSHNASLSGGVVTFPGASGDFNSGFAAQINGTFGPGTPFTFLDSVTSGFNPDAFTIGVVAGGVTPEPASFTLAIIGGLTIGGYLWRRRRPRIAV